MLWKLLSWPSAATVDAWAYAAWGQALARAERPLYELGATTPKPVAAVLGTLVAPLPAERRSPVVVALAAGGLAAALSRPPTVGAGRGGAVAAAVAVVALALGARLVAYVAFGLVDVVVAALVMAGVALRGRWRIAASSSPACSGRRPGSWPRSPDSRRRPAVLLAGWPEPSPPARPRRRSGFSSTSSSPAIRWPVSTGTSTGSALAAARALRGRTSRPSSWTRLGNAGGTVVVIAGLLGLGLYYFRARCRGDVDSVPLVVVLAWPLLLALQVGYGANLNARYLLPVAAVLALGCGLLAATFVTSTSPRATWAAVAVAAGTVALAAASADIPEGMRGSIDRNEAIAATRPTVESAQACGRVGVTRASAFRGLLRSLPRRHAARRRRGVQSPS